MALFLFKKWSRATFCIIGMTLLGLIFLLLVFAFAPERSEMRKIEVRVRGETFHVDVAEKALDRRDGLSGRDSLPEFGGMLFRFEKPARYSFWMKGMRFPIDILWLRDRRVVFLARNALPPEPGTPDSALESFRPDAEADEVLELGAGAIDRFGIERGDKVEVIGR